MDHQENTKNTSYEIIEGISYQFIDDGYIILNINNGEYYELNSSSSYIWDLISQKLTINVILDTAKNKFNLHNDDVLDIISIVDKFENLELIKKIKD